MKTIEGSMDFRGYKTWYVVHGKQSDQTPLFVLHGGPGYPHNSQNNIATLAKNGYQVILYDQLGCGLSDKPHNPSLWTVDVFVEELNALRKHLSFKAINLLGTSWGGSLALEYTLKYPANVNKLILHSPLIDTKLWVEEADKLKDLLPDRAGERMRQLEQSGDTDNEEYNELSDIFMENFVLRIKPWPPDFVDMLNNGSQEVYSTMWGPSEAFATGNLKDWSVIDRLSNIKQKTLLISGKYDEATPRQMEIITENIPSIKWELFENSSHSSNLEEPERYRRVVSSFLGDS